MFFTRNLNTQNLDKIAENNEEYVISECSFGIVYTPKNLILKTNTTKEMPQQKSHSQPEPAQPFDYYKAIRESIEKTRKQGHIIR